MNPTVILCAHACLCVRDSLYEITLVTCLLVCKFSLSINLSLEQKSQNLSKIKPSSLA